MATDGDFYLAIDRLLTYLRADVALLQPDHFYVIREVQTS